MVNDTQQIPAGYKQTDVGLIPEDWEFAPIPSLTVSGSSSIKIGPFGSALKKELLKKTGYKVYGQENVYKKDMDIGNRYISQSHFTSLKSCQITPGDFLISMMGTVGECMIAPESFETGIMDSHLLRIRFDKKIVNSRFVEQVFKTSIIYNQIGKLSVGGIMEGLSSKIIKNLFIPIPSNKNEQSAIVGVLADIDSLISKLDQLIQKKKNIKQGAMQKLLTGKRRLPGFSGEWEEKKLDQIADFYKGFGLSKSKIVNDGKYPCILYGELFTTYSEVINQVISHTNAIEGLTSKKGDVLLPGSTTTSGIDLATASSLEVENVLLGGDMIVLRKKTDEALNSQFLAHYLTHVSKYKIAEISQGITIIHLHGSRLKDISIFVPSDIKEQDAISRIIIEMSSEILLLESQRNKYQDLKQGMMQQLLTGRIRLI